jgi:hypothetical protein
MEKLPTMTEVLGLWWCVPSMGDVRAEYHFLTPKLVEAGYRVIKFMG